MRKLLLAALIAAFHPTPMLVGQSFEWLPGGAYNPKIPTPESVIGHEVGSYLTDHHQMVDYIHRLQEAGDRVLVIRFGRSVQRRDMYLLVISSPENLSRVEEIRESIARLTDPRSVTIEEVDRIVAEVPPIGWMNYANDGGETAAFEAGIQMAYQLAAGDDPLTRKILDNVVTILNMTANPDSHQTFVTWMKASTIGPNGTADPFASEHDPQWFISSDGNHYLVDLNRDAFAMTQVETRANARMLHHWNPQVFIDNHGEPNEYTFAPFTTPMNLNYPPALRDWATEIGRYTARYFNRFSWTYVKDETYDLYYPGYWDTYPALNGAVAATYETNGGGWKNFQWEKPDGTIATLRNAIHSHFIANMATLEALADNREGFLRYFFEFFETGMREAESEEIQSYVLLPGKDPGRLHDLVELLLRHRVEVYRLEADLVVEEARTYLDRSIQSRDLPAGSFVIPLAQPRKRLIQTLLEPEPKLEERFLREMAERMERDSRLGSRVRKEGSQFYDVSAWSLPILFGIDAVLSRRPAPLDEAVRIDEPPAFSGRVVNGPARYAYLFTSESDAGVKLAGRLLTEDYRVAIGTRPFTNSGIDFPSGTFVVRAERNPEALHRRIEELAQRFGATVYAVHTAWNEVGAGLGSRTIVDLQRPRILVMTDKPTSAVAFGGVHSLLEQRFELPFTAARAEYFSNIDLGRYNVIVFPDGTAEDYPWLLRERGVERLKQWIADGGTFIGLRGGARFATLPGVELTDVRVVTDVSQGEGEEDRRVPIERVPGSFFEVEINNDYHLGFGYARRMAVQFRGDWVLSTSETGASVAVFKENSHVMGHRWPETEKALAGNSFLNDVPIGRGRVILFTGDPAFRAYWRALDRMLINSMLLSPSF